MTNLEENILKSEILLKIQVTRKKIKKLSRETFPTLGPQGVLLLSAKILDKIIDQFEIYSLDQMIFIKTGVLRQIIILISYIENSTIKNVTWSTIPAYNMLLKSLLENVEYVIVPQWKENYSILNQNIVDDFEKHFKTFGVPETDGSEGNTMGKIPSKIYLIKYSRLEKLSALHLALLGHEIGHIFASQWMNEWYLDFATKETNLSSTLEEIALEELKKKNLATDMFVEFEKKKTIDHYHNLIGQNYKELLSDIFGCALFGHTFIIAMYLFSATSDLDKTNWPNGYLSWRFRLQNCIRFISFVFKRSNKKPDTYDLYENICSTVRGDIKDYKDKVCSLAIYSFMQKEEQIFTVMCEYAKTELFITKIDSEQISAACNRLENEIIPNAMLKSGIEYPIDIRNILYAIWLVSYKRNEPDTRLFSERIQFYNMLGIKGIELSVEQGEYDDFIKRQNQRET